MANLFTWSSAIYSGYFHDEIIVLSLCTITADFSLAWTILFVEVNALCVGFCCTPTSNFNSLVFTNNNS